MIATTTSHSKIQHLSRSVEKATSSKGYVHSAAKYLRRQFAFVLVSGLGLLYILRSVYDLGELIPRTEINASVTMADPVEAFVVSGPRGTEQPPIQIRASRYFSLQIEFGYPINAKISR